MVILETAENFLNIHYDAYAVTYERCLKANSVTGRS